MPATDEAQSIRVGLRFERSQLLPLQVVADAIRPFKSDDVRLMNFGIEAAASGEPLVLHCKDIDEANRIAQVYVDHGLKRPTIEELSGE